MPDVLKTYVRIVDRFNRGVGRVTMYLIFVMMGILLWSSMSKAFFLPSLWTLEMAQFVMSAYFLLGGAYSLQLDSHVRMDLAYGRWSPRTKAIVDVVTIFMLFTYLFFLESTVKCGQSCSHFGFGRRFQRRMPLLELGAQGAIESSGSGLQHEVRASF